VLCEENRINRDKSMLVTTRIPRIRLLWSKLRGNKLDLDLKRAWSSNPRHIVGRWILSSPEQSCAYLAPNLHQSCAKPLPTLHQTCANPVPTLRQLFVNTSSRFPLCAFSFVGCFHCCHVFWWVLHIQRNPAKPSVRIQCILYRSLSYQTVCGRQEGV